MHLSECLVSTSRLSLPLFEGTARPLGDTLSPSLTFLFILLDLLLLLLLLLPLAPDRGGFGHWSSGEWPNLRGDDSGGGLRRGAPPAFCGVPSACRGPRGGGRSFGFDTSDRL